MQSCATGRRRIPIDISGTPVLTAVRGTVYAGFTVSGSLGTAPYTFALIGSWPPGITIDAASGVVSGTPSLVGTFAALSVRALDRYGVPASLSPFAIVVTPPPLTDITLSQTTVAANSPAGTQIGTLGAVGGTPPYTFEVTSQ